MELNERIAFVRRAAGLSQEQLGEQLGVTRQAVSKWESGQTVPDAITISRLCQVLNVSADFVLLGKEPEESAPERPVPKTPARKSRPAEGTVSAAEVRQAEDRVFREVCQLVRDVQEKHPSVGYAVRLERSALLEAEGYAPARYEAWLVVSLGRNRTILESGPDTGEWPDARDRITRIRGGKLTVSDGYGRLSRELEAITADYEAGPDAYAENKAASDEMLREACRVEWIG